MAKEQAEGKPKEKEEAKKERRPQAQKRDLQNAKRRLRNRSFLSQVKTTLREFDETVQKGDKAKAQESLKQVYSLMDKGVKRGVYKKNKADRTKSRLTVRATA